MFMFMFMCDGGHVLYNLYSACVRSDADLLINSPYGTHAELHVHSCSCRVVDWIVSYFDWPRQ